MTALASAQQYVPVFEAKGRIEQLPRIAHYLGSSRRRKYSSGIFVRNHSSSQAVFTEFPKFSDIILSWMSSEACASRSITYAHITECGNERDRLKVGVAIVLGITS